MAEDFGPFSHLVKPDEQDYGPFASLVKKKEEGPPIDTSAPIGREGVLGTVQEMGKGIVRGALVTAPAAAAGALKFFGAEEQGGVLQRFAEEQQRNMPRALKESITAQMAKRDSMWSPLGAAGEAGEQSALSFGPAAAGAAIGAGIGAAAGGVGAVPGAGIGFLVGSLASMPIFYGAQAQESKEQIKAGLLKSGMPEAEAEAQANRGAHLAGTVEVGGEMLASAIPGSKLLRPFMKPVEGALVKSTVGRSVGKAFKDVAQIMAGEAATEVGQLAAQQEIEQRYGAAHEGATVEGSAKVIMPTLLMSLLPGGLTVAHNFYSIGKVRESLEDKEADKERRTAAASVVFHQLARSDQGVAKAFEQYAATQIAAGQPIKIEDDQFYLAQATKPKLPSEQAGIDPATGHLSSAAAAALNTGVAQAANAQQQQKADLVGQAQREEELRKAEPELTDEEIQKRLAAAPTPEAPPLTVTPEQALASAAAARAAAGQAEGETTQPIADMQPFATPEEAHAIAAAKTKRTGDEFKVIPHPTQANQFTVVPTGNKVPVEATKTEPAGIETDAEPIAPGSALSNGFMAGPTPGSRYRVSPRVANNAVFFETQRDKTSGKHGFYVGSDGNLIASDEIALNKTEDVARLWSPATDELRAEAASLLDQMGRLGLSDANRKAIKSKLRNLVTGKKEGENAESLRKDAGQIPPGGAVAPSGQDQGGANLQRQPEEGAGASVQPPVAGRPAPGLQQEVEGEAPTVRPSENVPTHPANVPGPQEKPSAAGKTAPEAQVTPVTPVTPTAAPTVTPTAPVDVAAHAAATSPLNNKPEPTPAQITAGNYEKGHTKIGGLPLAIENPEGSTRKSMPGVEPAWESTIQKAHYGYIENVPGADKDRLDAFVKPGTPEDHSGPIFVIDQKKPGGGFDEHKVMIGYANQAEAVAAYRANYPKEWDGIDAVSRVTPEEFKAWTKGGNTKLPFAPTRVGIVDKSTAEHPLRPFIENLIRRRAQAEHDVGAAIKRAKEIMAGTRQPTKLDAAWFRREANKSERTDKPTAKALTDIADKIESDLPPPEPKERSPKQKARDEELRREGKAKAARRRRIDPEKDSLITAIIKLGGLPNHLRRDITGDTKVNVRLPFVGFLFSDKAKLGIDVMAQDLAQTSYGYLTQGDLESADGGVQKLKDMIQDEIMGTPHYSLHYVFSNEQLDDAGYNDLSPEDQQIADQVYADADTYSEAQAEADAERAAIQAESEGGMTDEEVDQFFAAWDEEVGSIAARPEEEGEGRGEETPPRSEGLNEPEAVYNEVVTIASQNNYQQEPTVEPRSQIGLFSQQDAQVEQAPAPVPQEPALSPGATTVFRRVGEMKSAVFVVRTAEDAAQVFSDLKHSPRERLTILLTNDAGRPVGVAHMFAGAIAQTSVYPAEIVRMAYATPGATRIWIAHNHPSGTVTASRADEMLTIEIGDSFGPDLGITMMGHIIIAGEQANILDAKGDSQRKIKIPDLPKKFTIPIVDRIVVKMPWQKRTIGGPGEAKIVADAALGKDSGVLWLDAQNGVISVDRMSLSTMSQLRGTGGFAKLQRRIAEVNPARAIIKVDDSAEGKKAAANMAIALQSGGRDVSVLDVVQHQGSVLVSLAEHGQLPSSRGTLYSLGPIWRSTLSEAMDKAPWGKNDALPVKQLKNWFVANAAKFGVKKDEIEWVGVTDWLDALLESDVKSLTRGEVTRFIDQNGVRVEETVLGERALPEGFKEVIVLGGGYKIVGPGIEAYGESPLMAAINAQEKLVRQGAQWQKNGDNEKAQRFFERAEELTLWIEAYEGKGEATDTKFAGYTLPGGKNYRELLLTLPDKPLPANPDVTRVADGKWRVTLDGAGRGYVEGRNIDEALTNARASIRPADPNAFRSSHFDQPNILAHVRFNERTDADGRRVLFIEEIQSDWAQKGRKSGFAGSAHDAEHRFTQWATSKGFVDPEKNERTARIAERFVAEHFNKPGDSYWSQYKGETGAGFEVPSAPFVGKTEAWVALALKRMIRYAVDNGFDAVAWATGEQQAERYDLSKQVRRIYLTNPVFDGDSNKFLRGHLSASATTGNEIINREVTAAELPEIIGKDASDRIVNNPSRKEGRTKQTHVLEGDDLKVGGEGMRAFYDKIVPNVANDILKRIGGDKITQVDIGFGRGAYVIVDRNGNFVSPESRFVEQFRAQQVARVMGEEYSVSYSGPPPQAQPGFTITPAMREIASRGLPLFQVAQQKQETAVGMTPDGVRAALAGLTKNWKNAPKINITKSPSEWPVEAPPTARGMFHNGEVWLAAENLTSAEAAQFVTLHEIAGHYGLRGILGRNLSSIMERIYNSNAAIRAEADARQKFYAQRGVKISRATATEEALADRAAGGSISDVKGWKLLVAAIRNALRKLGFTVDFSEADVTALLVRARGFVERGRGDQQGAPRFNIAETIRAKPGANVRRIGKILGQSLYGDPANMQAVTVKELFQNSFDGVRAMIDNGSIKEGSIQIVVNETDRSVTFIDNGTGMSPEILATKFLEIAGTHKEGNRSSGGFGVAKMQFLYGNESIEVVTVRDGKMATLRSNGPELEEAMDDQSKAPDITVEPFNGHPDFPDGHGTKVKVVIPAEWTDPSTGEKKRIDFSSYYSSFDSMERSPLFAPIRVFWKTIDSNTSEAYANRSKGIQIPVGEGFPINDYVPVATVRYGWGAARLYASKERNHRWGPNLHVLSNGIWQFSQKINKNPVDMWSDPLPWTFYLDIEPAAKPEDPGYPFSTNRQDFAPITKKGFGNLVRYIGAMYRQAEAVGEADNFGTLEILTKGANGRVVSRSGVSLKPEKAFSGNVLTNINANAQVSIEDGKLVINGQDVQEIDIRSLEQGSKPALDEFKIDQSLVPADQVLLHDNIEVPAPDGGLLPRSISEIGRMKFGRRFDDFTFGVGDAFMRLRDMVVDTMRAAGDTSYSGLRNEPVGVSFDKEYRGVSIAIPFKAAFLNIAVPEKTDPRRAGLGFYGTMVHELAHYKVRDHTERFPAEMQRIVYELEAALPKEIAALKSELIKLVERHHDVLMYLEGLAGDPDSKPRGKRFTEFSGEARPGSAAQDVARLGGAGENAGGLRQRIAASGRVAADGGQRGATGGGATAAADVEPLFNLGADGAVGAATQYLYDTFNSAKKFNWLHNRVATMFHLAQINDKFRPVFQSVQRFIQDVSKFAHESADEAGDDLLPRLGRVSDVFKNATKMRQINRDVDAAGKALIAGTLADTRLTAQQLRDGVTVTARDAAEIIGDITIPPLSEKQIDYFMRMRAAIETSLDQANVSEMARMLKGEGLDSVIMQARVGRAAEGYETLVSALERQRDALLAAGENDEATRKSNLIAQLAEKRADVDALKNRGYAPLGRFGQYTVMVTQVLDGRAPTKLYYGMFESQRAANQMARKMQEIYPNAVVQRSTIDTESWKMYRGLSLDSLAAFAQSVGLDDDALVQEFLRMGVANHSAMKRLIHRQGIQGYSEDMRRVLAAFITSQARLSARNYHYGEMMNAVSKIDPVRDGGDVRAAASKLVNYVQNPIEEAQEIRGLLFVNFLGGSVASALTNMTQPIMMTLPFLSQFSNPVTAAGMLKRGLSVAGGQVSQDPILRAAMKRAADQGITEPQELHQLYAESIRGLGANLWARKGLRLWGSMFSLAESFNRRITFAAAFEMARQPGVIARINQAEANAGRETFNSPFDFAVYAVEATQGIYNKGNRPTWGRGPIGATLFTFKQFTISYIEFLARLPARERALAGSLLLFAAGLQGLPGADDLENLIDTIGQLMGFNTNSKRTLREQAVKQFGESFGGFLTHGISGIPGVPLDVQGRLGVHQLVPLSGAFKPSEVDKGRQIAQAIGPVGAFFQQAQHGMEALQAGNLPGFFAQGTPRAIQDALKGVDMWQAGVYKDFKGQKVIDVSKSDAVMKFFGVQPQSVAMRMRKDMDIRQDVTLYRFMEDTIADRWAKGIVNNDREEVDAALQDLQEWNTRNPEMPIRIIPGQIKQRVQSMLIDRETRTVKRAPREIRGVVAESLR